MIEPWLILGCWIAFLVASWGLTKWEDHKKRKNGGHHD